MYRSQENTQSKILDNDDNYDFRGATLAIDNSDGDLGSQRVDPMNRTSAVMTGSDALSPPTENESGVSSSQAGDNQSQTSTHLTTGDQIKPRIGSPRHFFSFRSGLFEQAIRDCLNIKLRPNSDADIKGHFLLTEISHWDNERERLVIVTSKSLHIIKYDFIAMRLLDCCTIGLNRFNKIIKGMLQYPSSSIIPRLEGITNGISSLFENDMFSLNRQQNQNQVPFESINVPNKLDIKKFKPLNRNQLGIRVMWNEEKPLSVLTSWNPFSREIPWKTFSNHPLYSYEDKYKSEGIQAELDKNRQYYSVQNLYEVLEQAIISDTQTDQNGIRKPCTMTEEPILLENYLNVGAMIHNKNNFGFFKVRGKFSF